MLRNVFRLHTLARSSACRFTKRNCSSEAAELTEGEQKLITVLKEKFPAANDVQVLDISGGCGAMFKVYIESTEFSGKRTVMQHRMVNEALKEEIKGMHGLNIITKVPD